MNRVILKQNKRKMALDAFICDGVRTPIGKFGGALSSVRADDLAALPITELLARHPQVDWSQTDEVIYGDANQAGEDNRNVARMAALLAGLPQDVPGITVNRLCASGMDAVGFAARGIKSGDYELVIAGGVESMSRAPFVMPKAETAFSRSNAVYDTTIGWRFVNPKMDAAYGTDSMPETADNVAGDYGISRADQDAFALRSQERWAAAQAAGRFADELCSVSIPQRRGDPIVVDTDEHPRPQTTVESLGKLRGITGADKSVTAGNARGVKRRQKTYNLSHKVEWAGGGLGKAKPVHHFSRLQPTKLANDILCHIGKHRIGTPKSHHGKLAKEITNFGKQRRIGKKINCQ